VSGQETRDRILDAAEHLFAHRGYERATIRDIATSADANLAAVGYYFRGKENLYVAVIERGLGLRTTALRRDLDQVRAAADGSPLAETIIAALVGAHLRGMTEGPGGYDFMLLLAAELQNPRPVVREIFRTHVHPIHAVYQAALAEACPGLGDAETSFVIVCAVAQALHFVHLRQQLDIAERENGEKPVHGGLTAPWVTLPLDAYIDHVTTHVARLTAGGLPGLAGGEAAR